MTEVVRRFIPWYASPDGGSCGRSVHHDPASKAYPFRSAAPATFVSRLWSRHVGVYDQGDVGDCTAEGGCGCLSTGRFTHRFRSQRTMQGVYHSETLIDGFGAPWPTNDRGSSGLAFAQVAKAKGWISRYEHCFDLNAVLTALQIGPVIAGTNWHEGMDRPDSAGLVHPTGSIRGGHEYCLVGIDVDARTIRAANSWGTSWGDGGYFTIGWDDFSALLAEQGDVTVLVA